jgi:hypothetical protein
MKRKILLSVGIMLLIPSMAMAITDASLSEPATILLTASGLIGLATLAALRKKFKK